MSDRIGDREQRIRERAYQLWEADGRPEGQAEEYWHRARAIEGDVGGDIGVESASENDREDARIDAEDARNDEAGIESFPASDPPARGGVTGGR